MRFQLRRSSQRDNPIIRRERLPRLCRPQLLDLEGRVTPDATPHNLAVSNFYQNWNNASLITANDDWSGVPSVVGYLGDDTIAEGVDPQTILKSYSTADVIANHGSNTAQTFGGIAEFDGLGAVALQADGTADAPNLVVSINTTGRSNLIMSYILRDIDGTADDAIQPVALQYRIGNAGDFINLPGGFVADATTGPNLAMKVTPVSVALPGAVNNQALVQFRIITSNAIGTDEWVSVDDIVVGCKEFPVNSHTTFGQRSPSVAVDADGDAVVVWTSYGQDGASYGVYGQWFNSAGAKVGGELQINTHTGGSQSLPMVAVDADGDAVVVWESYGQDGSGYGVFGQRFNVAGAKLGGEFQVNTYTTGGQSRPSVAVDADGDIFVVWQSSGQDGDNYGVFGQRFNAAGAKVGGEFQVNTHSLGRQSFPSVAVDSDGDAVVVWQSYGQDGSGYGVFGQRFNAAGAKVGGEFSINTYTTNYQRDASIAMDADGDALIVWASFGQDASGYGVYGQRFNSAGAKVGMEFPIHSHTTLSQAVPSAAMDADGDSLVVWQSYDQDGSQLGVFGQRLDSAAAKVGSEFQINIFTNNQQRFASVAVDADGDAVVVWNSYGQVGTDNDVVGQRFRSPSPHPQVLNIQINDGSPQRSLVTSLKVTFDAPVNFIGSPTTAFSLVNQKSTDSVSLNVSLDASGTVATLSFTGGSIDPGGSLADGLFTLTILGNEFTGSGFDGNGDGIPGDNYVLIGTPANGLFRLFGDSDGNGTVNTADFAVFRSVFGTGPSIFDFNNDGLTNAADFAQFRARFGVMLMP